MLMENIMMFTYLIAFVICVVTLTALFIALKKRNSDNRQIIIAMIVFVSNIALLTAVYFIILHLASLQSTLQTSLWILTAVCAIGCLVFFFVSKKVEIPKNNALR